MKTKISLLLWTLILCACSPVTITPLDTPNIGQGLDGKSQDTQQPSTEQCAFSWAQKPLDELTAIFKTSIKESNHDASARATAFGENCNYLDGRKVFHAIETDFYIEIPVTDLIDFEAFGNWIAKTMPVVESMPSDMIEGPQVGFVEYKFEKNLTEFLVVRVPIQTYKDSAQGKTGEELFQVFHTE